MVRFTLVAAAAAASSIASLPVPPARAITSRGTVESTGSTSCGSRGAFGDGVGAHHRHRRGKRPQLSQQRVAGPLRRGRSAAGVPRREGPGQSSRPPAEGVGRSEGSCPPARRRHGTRIRRNRSSCWCRTIPTRCALAKARRATDARRRPARVVAVSYPARAAAGERGGDLDRAVAADRRRRRRSASAATGKRSS